MYKRQGLNRKLIPNSAANDRVEHRYRPIPVREKVIISEPEYFGRTAVALVVKGDSLADILHNIFRRSRPHFSAEMPYYRTIIAIVRAASGRVNLRPNRIMPRHFPVMVKQVSIRNNIDIMRRHTLPRTHNLVVIPISYPGKINFLIPSQAVNQLKDRFLPFSQQYIIAVLSSLLIICLLYTSRCV